MTVENQSPRGGLRQGQRRAAAFEDVSPVVLSDTYEAGAGGTDLVTSRASAAWGSPIDVRGRDEVTILVDLVKVGSMTGLTIAFQDGYADGADDGTWYDRFGSEANAESTTVAVATTVRDLTLDVSGFANGSHKLAVTLKTRAPYMRFKPYGTGTVTNARCTLKGLRVQRYP